MAWLKIRYPTLLKYELNREMCARRKFKEYYERARASL